ncbi:hypothetical protein C8D99_1073 [Aminivibrio pyruvatiphilus]|uniref:Uncharacterized protein n=1 Tax=Aminivibrio pyruvatiphilus TaxID=1005740 RepID=A0A4R8MAT1_9BACT|nr:hypothetical protein [Aminivibrio pyruvatiphilus]TDY60796.1 hypothetical protein C8D99_1073 [Aminivibrio pyruvatiphilus]
MADYKRKNELRELLAPCNYQAEPGTPLALFLDFLVSDDPETGAQACIDRDMKQGDFRTRSQIPSQSCIRYVAQSLYADHGKKTVTLETIREKVKNACGHHFLGNFDRYCEQAAPSKDTGEESAT